jgi:hypothetical protein
MPYISQKKSSQILKTAKNRKLLLKKFLGVLNIEKLLPRQKFPQIGFYDEFLRSIEKKI